MEFEDIQDDSTQVGDEIPKEIRKLRTQAYDKAVMDLVDMIESGDIVLDPDYQRNYIWDNKRASLLIESILMCVPIPVVYMAEDEDQRWVVVDGLQRLNSLKRFFDNEFKLRNLEILDELNKEQYSTLNPRAKRILRNGIIRVIVIKSESHPEIKYDIFQRLNRGAVSLNEQELRNCMYRGRLCTLLKDARLYQPLLDALSLSEPHQRYWDSELLLRFLAIYDAYSYSEGKVQGYPNKMKTFLNRYMEANKNISEDDSKKLVSLIHETIGKVINVFGTPCFRRVKPEDGSVDSRLNRALMDTIMVNFAYFENDFLDAHKVEISELNARLPKENPTFNDALIYGTSDTKKLEYRINTFRDALEGLR